MADTKPIEDAPSEIPAAGDPFAQFAEWFALAATKEPNDHNAMALATVDASGLPNVRMVLLKGYDADGSSSANFESAKGGNCWPPSRTRLSLKACAANPHYDRGGHTPKPTPISPRVRRTVRSAPGPAPMRALKPLGLETEVICGEIRPDESPRPPHWSGFRLAPTEIDSARPSVPPARPPAYHRESPVRRGEPNVVP
jgi:pyridoxamine 5'-phosphate oxidase